MSVKELICPECNSKFTARRLQTYCSKKCSSTVNRRNTLNNRRKNPPVEEELTTEYYEQYRKEAKEWKARTDAYDRDWIVRNQIVEKPKCRCCGELLLVPFQKHYCTWSCYYDYHVKDIKFDKGEISET